MSPSLIKRIISALILAPCFLYAIVSGGLVLTIWLVIAFLISVYEWSSVAKQTNYFAPIVVMGVIYIGISYVSFLVLRETYLLPLIGLLIGMVWMSDIGAYAFGKILGGPKLIEEISPNKTWSGFAGALLCPALFGTVWVSFMGIAPQFEYTNLYVLLYTSIIFGIVIGCAGQVGDLLVSLLKRQAGVKDTGTLIPGHGGLLDRIDSLLLATPVCLIMVTILSHVS